VDAPLARQGRARPSAGGGESGAPHRTAVGARDQESQRGTSGADCGNTGFYVDGRRGRAANGRAHRRAREPHESAAGAGWRDSDKVIVPVERRPTGSPHTRDNTVPFL
jgi:hypothetical protein